ncbi:amidohydrolase family protein, partial [Salinispira pacifica]
MSSIIWHNARVITMNAAAPRAEALVVADGTIQFAGSSKEALAQAEPDSTLHDLGGRTVIPGFNDNHVHSVILGDHTHVPNLADMSAQQIVATVHNHYAGTPPGRLIIAYGWDYPACPEPHRAILDQTFPDNPVVLPQYGGHGQWLNSRALESIGITRDSPDPPNVVIVRDADGEPTGVIREMTSNPLVIGHFFGMHAEQEMRDQRLFIALDRFRRLGITSVQDNTWYAPTAFSLARLRDRNELSVRYSCWSHGMMPETIPLMALPPYDDAWVRRGPWKYFLDG